MDEPISSAPPSGKRLRFSLLQLVAVTTSVGAAFALCLVLFSPPLGSSGLVEALLPAVVLGIALWFCRSGRVARLGTYAVVASLLSVLFFLRWFAQEDWLFGHTHGPPQLVIALCLASTIGVFAGSGWLISKLIARQNSSEATPAAESRRPRAAGWLTTSAIAVLTLLSALLAVPSIPILLSDMPRIGKKLDVYVEQRLRTGRHSILELANATRNSWSSKRPEIAEIMANQSARPGDEAAIPALLKLVRNSDPRVRRAASKTLRSVINQAANMGKPVTADPAIRAALIGGLNDADDGVQRLVALAILDQNQINFDDRRARLAAITALGSAQDRNAVDEAVPMLLRVLEGPPDEEYRIEAIRSLGRMGPNVTLGFSGTGRQAVSRLSVLVESRFASPAVRSESAKALGAMGPAAKAAVPSFGRAQGWHLLSAEDAQALYKIDPVAAERFQITRENSAAPTRETLMRDDGRPVRPPLNNTPSGPIDRSLNNGNTDDPKQLAELIHTLNDDDRRIRDEAATTLYAAFGFPRRFHNLPPSVVGDLVEASKRPEIKVGTAAVTAIRLMGPSAADAVPALLEITKNPPSSVRLQAIYALGEIGPAAAEAVPRLSEILSTDTDNDARQRSGAAKALGAIGPAAKSAVPAFGEAWKKHLITSEDAQALYRIDVEAAEELKIPRRQAGS